MIRRAAMVALAVLAIIGQCAWSPVEPPPAVLALHKAQQATATPWYLSGGVSAANCVAAYSAKGAASQAASYINLTGNATYDLVAVDAPTWDAVTGWTFDGSSDYLNSNLTPAADQSWSVIVKLSAAASPSVTDAAFGIENTFLLVTAGSGVNRVYRNSGGILALAGYAGTGVYCISGTNVYENGVFAGSMTAGTTSTTRKIYIGCRNNGGSPQYYFEGSISHIAFYSEPLTAAQVQAIGAAMP